MRPERRQHGRACAGGRGRRSAPRAGSGPRRSARSAPGARSPRGARSRAGSGRARRRSARARASGRARAARAGSTRRPSRRRRPRSARRRPRRASVSRERSSGQSRRPAMRSTSIRFRSSGIERSPLRRPASTWASGIAGGDGRPRAGERRVRVAEDERRVGPLRLERRGDARLHRARVGRVQVEPVLRLRQVELLEEHLRELAVPVLAGVEDDLLDPALAQRDRERPRLHELRPVPDDGEDLHRGCGRRGRIGATLAAARALLPSRLPLRPFPRRPLVHRTSTMPGRASASSRWSARTRRSSPYSRPRADASYRSSGALTRRIRLDRRYAGRRPRAVSSVGRAGDS